MGLNKRIQRKYRDILTHHDLKECITEFDQKINLMRRTLESFDEELRK